MTRRMKIMLIALIVLLPFSLYRVYTTIWGKSRPRSASVIRQPSRTIAPSPAAKKKAAAKEEIGGEAKEFQPIPVNTITFREQLASGGWGRNPFLTPGEIRSPKKALTKAPTVARRTAIPLTVTSVLVSADGSVAVINGEFYTVGDAVPGTGKRIAAITPDEVVIGGADERQELLPLAQSKIRLESREMR